MEIVGPLSVCRMMVRGDGRLKLDGIEAESWIKGFENQIMETHILQLRLVSMSTIGKTVKQVLTPSRYGRNAAAYYLYVHFNV